MLLNKSLRAYARSAWELQYVRKHSKILFPLTYFSSLIILYTFGTLELYERANVVCTNTTLPIKISFFCVVAVILLWLGINTNLNAFGAGLILSGGLTIITESFVRGCVMDYWSFFGLFRFNLADSFISMGALLLARELLIKKKT